MSPIDDTPHAGEIMQPPERRIPQPLPGQEHEQQSRGNARADEPSQAEVVRRRPPLPRHGQPSGECGRREASEAAIEHRRVMDERGAKSLKKQRG